MHIGLGAIRKTAVELVEDAVFAAHVMSRLGLVAEGRATQYEFLPRVLQQVGQVRGAAGELADPRLSLQAGDMRLEIGIDDGSVEFFAFAAADGLVGQRHVGPFCYLSRHLAARSPAWEIHLPYQERQ
ncbi:hypothetical protein D9M73_236230 [compost metagenome]